MKVSGSTRSRTASSGARCVAIEIDLVSPAGKTTRVTRERRGSSTTAPRAARTSASTLPRRRSALAVRTAAGSRPLCHDDAHDARTLRPRRGREPLPPGHAPLLRRARPAARPRPRFRDRAASAARVRLRSSPRRRMFCRPSPAGSPGPSKPTPSSRRHDPAAEPLADPDLGMPCARVLADVREALLDDPEDLDLLVGREHRAGDLQVDVVRRRP